MTKANYIDWENLRNIPFFLCQVVEDEQNQEIVLYYLGERVFHDYDHVGHYMRSAIVLFRQIRKRTADWVNLRNLWTLRNCIREYRDTHNWIFMLLPVAGVLIVFMYEKIGRQDGGTNQVLATIKSKDDVPFLSAPLIFVSTLLTHLTGGSAGREGASIQFGGSIGNWLGKLAHLDEFDHHVLVMCGRSAAFAGLSGVFDRWQRKEGEKMEDNKKCTTIWLRPSVIRRMDAWMEEANCRSRSEFIEKAVRFYMGYLGTEDTSEYLSDALVATLRGIIADSANRTNGILFKCAVEQGIMAHTIAAHFRDTLEDRRALRGYVVDEVKRTNGQIRFEDAQDVQRQLPDDTWRD